MNAAVRVQYWYTLNAADGSCHISMYVLTANSSSINLDSLIAVELLVEAVHYSNKWQTDWRHCSVATAACRLHYRYRSEFSSW